MVRESQPILEVIVCTAVDAIEAEKGGAQRLELIRDFARGGMTPSFETVADVINSVSVPVRVMLRESESHHVFEESQIEQLCVHAREFAKFKIDGLVLGFLRDQKVDVEITKRILSSVPELKATFHHAFEHARDSNEAIETLKSIRQIDRILTAGGQGNWSQKIERLGLYEQLAGPEITILAGGGLNKQHIQAIRAHTNINEFHVGRAARLQFQIDGPVEAENVKELVR